MKPANIEKAYRIAQDQFDELGVNTAAALKKLAAVPISMHCWQGDDVNGFERAGGLTDGGIVATGNYPGRARNAQELRADIEKVLSLVPGRHRLNLHSIYAETPGKRVERNEITPSHFANWIDWAREHKLGMDFNPSFFSHPNAASGLTLSHPDKSIRRFWIEHGIACRKIGEAFGRKLGSPCVTNYWIPDGSKDAPADRLRPRTILTESLDEIFARPVSPKFNLDAVECKLFGIGSESYVVGSHEFYMGYAVTRGKLLCLDTGHFHPTETIADKISATLLFIPGLLLHVSRGVRWDSDHVVTLSDDTREIMRELVRGNFLDRTHIGLDYFDASINRVAAWTIGMRNACKALLIALLEPTARIQQCEKRGDFTGRLAWTEEARLLPFDAVWNYYCLSQNVPVGGDWLAESHQYERDVLSHRTTH